jgi:hypothetical protein
VTPEHPNKRLLIGVITIFCVSGAGISALFGDWNSATTAAFVRVATVMAALWLAYPAFHKRAAWQKFYRGVIITLVVSAVFISRLRFFLPVIGVVLVAFWFVRPKTWRRK